MTRTRICPGPACDAGTSRRFRASGPPKDSSSTGEIAHAQTRAELLTAITEILDAARAAGELRADITAEDFTAALIGIFTAAPPPQHEARAHRLLNIFMDGLRPPG